MKHAEFYKKVKAHRVKAFHSLFDRRNRWLLIIGSLLVFLIEPVITYRYHRSVPFSITYYFHQEKLFFISVILFITPILWLNYREALLQQRGYDWIGEFKVVGKRISLLFSHQLILHPGTDHQLRVNQSVFAMIRVGESIFIRRNALGGIEEVKRLSNTRARLTRSLSKYGSKKT